MPRFAPALASLIAAIGLAATAQAAPQLGAPAPDFTGIAADGRTLSLSDFAGRTVVLEWTNHDCPYVRKHYETGNMQAVQKDAAEDGVVWLSVISSAPGSQGHVSPAQAEALSLDRAAAPEAVILDAEGAIGRAYAAMTTPHMYIIDPSGALVYQGAIDDKRSSRASSVEGAENYVVAALDDLAAGRAVQTAQTRPYGCSVKYAD